jgi:RNA polymerase sigma-B factor
MEHQTDYKRAPEQLYEQNSHLIRQAAYKWRVNNHHDQEDIKATASEGLYEAAVNYDPDRGGGFQRYATRVIQTRLKEKVAADSHSTRYEFSHKSEVLQAERELKKALNRRPTDKEISIKTGHPEGVITRVRNPVTVISLEDLRHEPEAVPEIGDTEELIAEVIEAVKRLPRAQRTIIEQLYLQGYTQAEIAENEGISQQAVSKRAAAAIEALKAEIQESAA